MPILIGRHTGGFALEGTTPTAAKKRALLLRWVKETRAVSARDAQASWHWIAFVSRAEALLVPDGKLSTSLRAMHDAYCKILDEKEQERAMHASLERIGKSTAEDFFGAQNLAPIGLLDGDALALHGDIGGAVKKELKRGDADEALRAALYPSSYLTAWTSMSPELAELVSLPLRVAWREALIELGATERLDSARRIKSAVERAVAKSQTRESKIRLQLDALACENPLAFAQSFNQQLRRLRPVEKRRAQLIARETLPPPVESFAPPRRGTALPRENPFDDELRKDHGFLLARGLQAIELPADAEPEAIVESMHRLIGEVQSGKRRLDGKARAAIAVAWGEQLVRAAGWQWTRVVYTSGDDGVAGIVSPDRSRAHFPLQLIARLAKKGERENTLALSFNMIRADARPPGAKPGRYLRVG